MNYIGIIPARFASTRFPGKPLALIGGKPMIQRVYEQAHSVLQRVIVATDDSRIYDCVRQFGGEVMMTSTACRCGTERCAEVLQSLLAEEQTDPRQLVVINIQGDEPFIQPEQIGALQSCFDQPDTEIATLVQPYTRANTWEELENPNSPKVALSDDGYALLFSRSIIPYLRGIPREQWLSQGRHFKHIGMYAYRADVLPRLVALQPSPLEQQESLEQLRWLENGYRIRVAKCATASIGIDTPEDLKRAQEFLATLK